jgi:hypothetical protein
MVNVFSFTLFGSSDKYCKGLLRNIELIHEFFPDFETWVYLGNDVPAHILQALQESKNVRCIFTGEVGLVNKFYRLFAIDSPEVDVCFVRDADSRIFARDRSTVKDFLESDKLFHIVRDHPNHNHKIMAGIISIRKGLLSQNLQDIFDEYRKSNEVITFWNDQEFLREIFYPRVLSVSMIHDDLQQFEPYSMKTRFKEPIGDALHFVGQVYEFDENGNEYPKFTDYLDGGVYGKEFWTQERKERLGINLKGSKVSNNCINAVFQLYTYDTSNSLSEDELQKKQRRQAEITQCLVCNLNNPALEKFHIFVDSAKTLEYYKNITNASTKSITYIQFGQQPTYKDFIEYIKNSIPDNEYVFLCHSDIFLHTIDLNLCKYYLEGKVIFGLTRHEPTDEHHSICNPDTCMVYTPGGCGDSYLFKTPVPNELDTDAIHYYQNVYGGECVFLHEWYKAGYKILNPCYQIITMHLHKGGIYFEQYRKVTRTRPYFPELEPPPTDTNSCMNRPIYLYGMNPPLCFRCKGHPNAFSTWRNKGANWTCSLCLMEN